MSGIPELSQRSENRCALGRKQQRAQRSFGNRAISIRYLSILAMLLLGLASPVSAETLRAGGGGRGNEFAPAPVRRIRSDGRWEISGYSQPWKHWWPASTIGERPRYRGFGPAIDCRRARARIEGCCRDSHPVRTCHISPRAERSEEHGNRRHFQVAESNMGRRCGHPRDPAAEER